MGLLGLLRLLRLMGLLGVLGFRIIHIREEIGISVEIAQLLGEHKHMVEVLCQVGRHGSCHSQSTGQSHDGRRGGGQCRMIGDTLLGQLVDNLFGNDGVGTNAANHLQARLVTVGTQFLTQECDSVDFHSRHLQHGSQDFAPN